jgi:hypothetical protein
MSVRIKCAVGQCKWTRDHSPLQAPSRAKWFIRNPDGSLKPVCSVHGANEKVRVKLTDGYREWCVQDTMAG